MNEDYLEHHGIKGMKWGVRRYQNADGSLTAAGRKRRSEMSTEEKSQQNKKIAKVGAGIATVATMSAAAYYVHKHPDAIGKVVSQFKDTKLSSVSKATVNSGKKYVQEAMASAKEGAKEAMKEAPKKAAKAVVTGVVLNATKKALDSAVGKEESAKIFQANDNKKIGKFWKVSPEDKEEDDD